MQESPTLSSLLCVGQATRPQKRRVAGYSHHHPLKNAHNYKKKTKIQHIHTGGEEKFRKKKRKTKKKNEQRRGTFNGKKNKRQKRGRSEGLWWWWWWQQEGEKTCVGTCVLLAAFPPPPPPHTHTPPHHPLPSSPLLTRRLSLQERMYRRAHPPPSPILVHAQIVKKIFSFLFSHPIPLVLALLPSQVLRNKGGEVFL